MTLPLLTVQEVAATLRVSRAQVYLLKERIGYVRVGKGIRFESSAVQAFIEGSRKCHAPAIASTSVAIRPTGGPSGPTTMAGTTASPRAAEIMRRLLGGSRRGRSNASGQVPASK